MVNIKTLLGEFRALVYVDNPLLVAPREPGLPRDSVVCNVGAPTPCISLDKATNSDLSEPDWETILDIVEEIKQKNVS